MNQFNFSWICATVWCDCGVCGGCRSCGSSVGGCVCGRQERRQLVDRWSTHNPALRVAPGGQHLHGGRRGSTGTRQHRTARDPICRHRSGQSGDSGGQVE